MAAMQGVKNTRDGGLAGRRVVATVETRGLWVAVVAMEQWWWGLLLALCDDVWDWWLCGGDGRHVGLQCGDGGDGWLGGAAVWRWW